MKNCDVLLSSFCENAKSHSKPRMKKRKKTIALLVLPNTKKKFFFLSLNLY